MHAKWNIEKILPVPAPEKSGINITIYPNSGSLKYNKRTKVTYIEAFPNFYTRKKDDKSLAVSSKWNADAIEDYCSSILVLKMIHLPSHPITPETKCNNILINNFSPKFPGPPCLDSDVELDQYLSDNQLEEDFFSRTPLLQI